MFSSNRASSPCPPSPAGSASSARSRRLAGAAGGSSAKWWVRGAVARRAQRIGLMRDGRLKIRPTGHADGSAATGPERAPAASTS